MAVKLSYNGIDRRSMTDSYPPTIEIVTDTTLIMPKPGGEITREDQSNSGKSAGPILTRCPPRRPRLLKAG